MSQPVPAPVSSLASGDLTGTTVGRFRIRARLGGGGMGEVYQADDTLLKRSVALKRIAPKLRADQQYRKRFLREAQHASSLTNPHIAGVYDVLQENGEIFVVMEYVEGHTLRQRFAEPMSLEQFLAIAVQCVAALVAAHERGIVHRDIKPENVMLSPSGQVKVLDFGVAKLLPRGDEGVTLETQATASAASRQIDASGMSGTPAYMAPEVLLEKEVDQRADLFSLGVVFYEALTGRHPFRASSWVATSSRILNENPPPPGQFNSKIPAELDRIIAKMLGKDPAERYATAADLLVDLRAVQRVLGRPVSLPTLVPRVGYRRKWLAGVALVITVFLGVGFLPPVRHWLSSSLFPPVLPGSKNLAVLPFRVIGGGPETQAFSDGITETLTAKLTQLTATHNLQVVPAAELRGRKVSTTTDARREFGISLVLDGTLQYSGDKVRVNYALVDAAALRQLRTGTITVDLSDPFGVQDEVVQAAVTMLELQLAPQERQNLESHGTQSASAYEFYLQGRGYLQNYDKPENIDHAINVFQRALSGDPNYALAHAGLGEAFWRKYDSRKETTLVDSARHHCEVALEADPKPAAAHVCLGIVYNATGEYGKAAAEFERALALEPTSDAAYRGLAFAFEQQSKPADAEKTYGRAIELRPNYWAGYSWLGAFYFGQARYSEAERMFRQAAALTPDNFRVLSNLGGIYLMQGRYPEAITVLERSVSLRPTAGADSNLATAYFYQRRFADAARTYEGALKLEERNLTLWRNLAEAYYWTPGKRPEATRACLRAIALARDQLQVNPRDLDVLRNSAYCYAVSGDPKRALESLGLALKIAPNNPNLHFQAALVYMESGQAGQALAWLEKAVRGGYSASTVRDTPNFDPLRGNPRFQELLRGTGSNKKGDDHD